MRKSLHQTQQRVGALDDLVLIELIGGRVVDGLGGAILLSRPIRQRRDRTGLSTILLGNLSQVMTSKLWTPLLTYRDNLSLRNPLPYFWLPFLFDSGGPLTPHWQGITRENHSNIPINKITTSLFILIAT